MADQHSRAQLVRVLLADDNKEIRETVAGILGSTKKFDIVAAVADGREMVNAGLELKPDIGIIDISMPIMNGISAAAELRKLGSEMKIIFLTVNEDCDFVRAAFETGAKGYVVKRRMASDLPLAISEVQAGRRFISSGFDTGVDL